MVIEITRVNLTLPEVLKITWSKGACFIINKKLQTKVPNNLATLLLSRIPNLYAPPIEMSVNVDPYDLSYMITTSDSTGKSQYWKVQRTTHLQKPLR